MALPSNADYGAIETRRQTIDSSWRAVDDEVARQQTNRIAAEARFKRVTSDKWRALWQSRQDVLDEANNALISANTELCKWRIELKTQSRLLEAQRKRIERDFADKASREYQDALDALTIDYEEHLDTCEQLFLTQYQQYVHNVDLYLVELHEGISLSEKKDLSAAVIDTVASHANSVVSAAKTITEAIRNLRGKSG